jgi:hypothetical protein
VPCQVEVESDGQDNLRTGFRWPAALRKCRPMVATRHLGRAPTNADSRFKKSKNGQHWPAHVSLDRSSFQATIMGAVDAYFSSPCGGPSALLVRSQQGSGRVPRFCLDERWRQLWSSVIFVSCRKLCRRRAADQWRLSRGHGWRGCGQRTAGHGRLQSERQAHHPDRLRVNSSPSIS